MFGKLISGFSLISGVLLNQVQDGSHIDMKKAWKYFLFLLWLSYLFVCGILLFTRGFLLSRRTLLQKSTCVENSDCSAFQKLSREEPSFINTQKYLDCLDRNQLKLRENSENHCIESNKRIVLILIDALRYDFARFNNSIKPDELLPFQNRLKIIDELLTTLPNNSLLYKFIANPPTTTMQRLKGLTTGSLPTFIDVGSNFATPEIDEDNILDQLIDQDKKIVFMGDDTWTALYPGRFKRQYSYPSFNVWDLDTVDTGIMTHLKQELQQKDWSLLIAHFLGVDHCGHKYGPFHSEMTRKLNQMNEVIKDVVDTIDDDTILFVIGDHGMTPTGDHGGESEDEVTSALFIYSPVPFLSGNIVTKTDSVYQVDIVPTLSAILGFAIPFSNLGKVILSALPSTQEANKNELQSDNQYALKVLSNNIEQIMLYMNTYSRQTHAFSKEKISKLLEKFHSLKWRLGTVNDNKSFIFFQETVIEFLNYVRELCEEVWVQFDSFSMSRGLVLTFLLISFTFFIIEGIPCSHFNAVLDGAFLWIAYGTGFICIMASVVLQYYKMVEDMYLLIYVSTLSLSMLILAIVVVQNWEEITMLWFNTYKNRDWLDVLTRFIHLCSLLLMFSNSFVIEEGTVLSFMLNTVIWLIVFNVNNQKYESHPMKTKSSDKVSWIWKLLNQSKFRHLALAVIFTLLLRTSRYFWRCREEQRWCIVATDPLKSYTSFKSGKGSIDLVITLAFLGLFVSLTRIWLRNCGNLVGFSPTVVMVRYAPSVIVVCLGGYWVLQGLPKEARNKLFIPWQLQILPWTVFALIGLTIICLFLQPVCVYVMEKKTDFISVYGNENIIPQLFHQVKKVIKNSDGNESDSVKSRSPLVYGLATAYSAVFIILGEFVSLFVISLLGDALASSVVLMFVTIVVLLAVLAYARLENTLVTTQLFHVPWSYVLSWGLLASYFFYGTGHQPTFPGIHWYAAFVGTGGQFSSNYIPGFLIGANTFCSYIIAGLLLPTLLIAPFTLPVILPKWLSSKSSYPLKKQQRPEMREGDITLYEKEGLTDYALLKVSSKYMLYHGTRIFTCMLAAAVHCRHLMVWMIFTPRFIFEALSFMVTMGAVLLGYLLVMRTSTKIDHLMKDLLKKHDI